jgi:hypothetical protein
MVTYSAETRVIDRGREYPVTQLEPGDIVAMQLGKDSRGNPHTHLILVRRTPRIDLRNSCSIQIFHPYPFYEKFSTRHRFRRQR